MVVGLAGLGVSQLQYFPSTSLVAMGNTVAAEKGKLNNKIAQATARLDKLLGKGSIVSPAGGRSAVKGFGSLENAIQTAVQQGLPVEATTELFENAMEQFNSAEEEATELFKNFDQSEIQGPVSEAIDGLKAYFSTYPVDPISIQRVNDETAGLQADVVGLINEVRELEAILNAIEEILEKRSNGELEEPIINSAYLGDGEAATNYINFVRDNIVFPFEENLERFKSITDQVLEDGGEAPIFDLVYGPPVSVNGQFVLSEDGLYYDSRSGGLPDISGVSFASGSWDLQFPPNLGGKGEFYTKERSDGVFNTVLDYGYDADDPMIAAFQLADDVLETFEKDKARHLHIVSGQITELKAGGYADDSALVVNYYNSLAAVASTYDAKIRKRKKQLQLVALFGTSSFNFTHIVEEGYDPPGSGPLTSVYGPGVLVENRGQPSEAPDWHPVDRVPINDFTFLKGKPIDVSLESQSEILLLSEDLDDTLLPIVPKFLVSPPQTFSYLERFSIDTIAPTEFIHIDGTPGVSGTGSFVKSLRDDMVTSGLVVGYNFTTPSVVAASSTEFNLDNIVPDSSGLLDAQLVGSSVNYVFPSGLTIPKLRGTYYNAIEGALPKDTGRNGGSYVKLRNNWDVVTDTPYVATRALENITYSNTTDPNTGFGGGFSFDFWVHMPDLLMTDAHRYRLVLANENSGRGWDDATPAEPRVISNRKNPDTLENRANVVHGFLMGFRDKGGVTSPSGLEFCVLPTVSQNYKQDADDPVHSICIAEKYTTFNEANLPAGSGITELGFKVGTSETTSKGITIKDASSAFTHFSISFDVVQDVVSLYVDGYLMKTGVFSTDFDLAVSGTLGAPTLSRSDTVAGEQNSYNNTIYNGPNLGSLGDAFTPWIIGGGFTDGIDSSGFLGKNTNTAYDASSLYGQHTPNLGSSSESGLNGFVGSFKVYNRPLTSSEVLKNFKAQKGFFKNIFI